MEVLAMPKKKTEKVHLTINVTKELNDWLDNTAPELGMTKSQLASNLIEMGKDDAEILKGVGFVGAVKKIRQLQEKLKGNAEIEAGE